MTQRSGNLTIALSKGKLLDPALELLARVGLLSKKISQESRRLVFEDRASRTTIMIIRPTDVPTYVEYGAVDAGIVGADVLMEQATDVYEPLDLRFGACRLAVAAPVAIKSNGRVTSHSPTPDAISPARPASAKTSAFPVGRVPYPRLRVATKYPNITERHFTHKGVPIEIIKLYGSIELAPMVGLADCIVDLVSSGQTLKAHNLVVKEVIALSTARLIVNRASLKLHYQRVNDLVEALRKGLQGRRL